MKIFFILLILFLHSGWTTLAPEDLQELRAIYSSKINILEDRRDRAEVFLMEVKKTQNSDAGLKRLKEIFICCGGNSQQNDFGVLHRQLLTKLLDDVQTMSANVRNIRELSQTNLNPVDMIPKMLKDSHSVFLRRMDPEKHIPFVTPEIMDYEKYSAEERAQAAFAVEVRADDNYCLKILCRAMTPEWISQEFKPYIKEFRSRRLDANPGWFFAGYFMVLKAYVFDLVENPPSPDQWYLRFSERNFEVLNTNLQTLNDLIAPFLLQKIQIQNQLQTVIEALRPAFQRKLAEIQVEIGGLEKKKNDTDQEKKRFQTLVFMLGSLRSAEEEALQQLNLFDQRKIQRGNFLKIKAEKAAITAAEEAKKTRIDGKKARQAARKALDEANLARRALEREQERKDAELTYALKVSQQSPIAQSAEVASVGPAEFVSVLEPSVQIQAAAVAFPDEPMAQDLNPEIREEVRAAMAEMEAYNQRRPQAAEALVLEDVAQKQIHLPRNDLDLVTNFWRDRTLSWKAFSCFFTRILGATLDAQAGGSIRKFIFQNGKKIIVHEPHAGSKEDLGPHTLGRVRAWLQENLGLSQDSFALKI